VLTLPVRLDELYHGCTKKKSYMRRVYRNGHRFTIIDELSVKIPPGMEDHSFIRFRGRGDECLRADWIYPTGQIETGDVLVQIILQQSTKSPLKLMSGFGNCQHLWFEYNGLCLRDALVGTDRKIMIPSHPAYSKKGKDLELVLPDNLIIYDKYIHIVRGLGMPLYNSKGKFGDLFVQFRIQFPSSLSQEKRSKIRSILSEHDKTNEQSSYPHHNNNKINALASSFLWGHIASKPVRLTLKTLEQHLSNSNDSTNTT
jgi:DnaJ-class molecular chaperone